MPPKPSAVQGRMGSGDGLMLETNEGSFHSCPSKAEGAAYLYVRDLSPLNPAVDCTR